MVFRKYKPAKQWGKMDTRIFKEILNSRNKRKMPSFRVPDAVTAAGVDVHNPNDASFWSWNNNSQEKLIVNHPAFRVPGIEEHPLYHQIRCYLFDGTEAMSDGVAQACNLSKSILREGIPEAIIHEHGLELSEDVIRDSILHGERYDPTLEKLPQRFDPVMFWIKHVRVHGTPVLKRNSIILNNLYRKVVLTALQNGRLSVNDQFRYDRNEPISALVNSGKQFEVSPLVLRFQPNITVQAMGATKPWANEHQVKEMSEESVADISPLSPLIDLGSDHLYNDEAVIARSQYDGTHKSARLESSQSRIWTDEAPDPVEDLICNEKSRMKGEQNTANAIGHVFGAAVAQATRAGRNPEHLETKPVLVKGIQLVDGGVDLVAFQLNTLDFRPENPVKNITWIDRGLRLYKTKPYYEQITQVEDLDVGVVRKIAALLLCR